MDPRVKKAIDEKIKVAISNTSEATSIVQKLEGIPTSNRDDFAYGIAIGRIYNSFHYQTRRTLKRNATKEEFDEFLDILIQNAGAIRAALQKK